MAEETDPAISVRDAIEKAVNDFLAANGGGIPTGYVAMFEWVNDQGEQVFIVAQPEDQPTYRSMGFTAYMHEWYQDDARMEMSGVWNMRDDEED